MLFVVVLQLTLITRILS